mgnify:CR=1 FL=1
MKKDLSLLYDPYAAVENLIHKSLHCQFKTVAWLFFLCQFQTIVKQFIFCFHEQSVNTKRPLFYTHYWLMIIHIWNLTMLDAYIK